MDRWLKDFVNQFRRMRTRNRPYRNAAVSFRRCAQDEFEARARLARSVGLNVFRFPADRIPGCDLLTDSGTTTMTMEQWSQLLLGDESYGSNEGYFAFKDQIVETFGPTWENRDRLNENTFIFHQGRAAEHGMFKVLAGLIGAASARERFVIPSNGHFDTTQANIEDNGLEARNLFSPELRRHDAQAQFKGDMDVRALKVLLDDPAMRRRIPLVYMTITNNTGGGQPVSLSNIRAVRRLTAKHGIPLMLDACRFAENAWFIRHSEPGMARRAVSEIVRLVFDQVDGFHISLKKDGLANIGGALVVKEKSLFTERFPKFQSLLTDHQILVEGHPTYGGLAGRDLKGIVEGLKTVVREDYLTHRIAQVQRFGARIQELSGNKKVVMSPVGGHAVYLDIDEFFAGTRLRDADLPGIALTGLLLIAGHRLCELGIYAFGHREQGREIPPSPRVNYVRAAVPRLAYEDQDLFALAEVIAGLYRRRDSLPGVTVTHGQDLRLRHFKSRFRFNLKRS
jgi:tryptophanase